jgi:hypothetical protein
VNCLFREQRQQRQTQRSKWPASRVQDVDGLSRESLLRFLNGVIKATKIDDCSSHIKQAASCIERRETFFLSDPKLSPEEAAELAAEYPVASRR